MKISIITVCLNSEKTISDTINSVNSQTYKNIEHIFIDGGSRDKTLEILKKNPNKNKKIYIKKNYGIYKSMNFGILKSTGDIIQILNSDDIYFSNNKIEEVVKVIKKKPRNDIYMGDVIYFNHNNFYNFSRYFKADSEKIKNMHIGLMPPHPASFIRRQVYNECGFYKDDFQIAADFEYFYRIIYIKKKKFKFLRNIVVNMRTGGISTKYFKSYSIITNEIIKSLKEHKQKFSTVLIYLRGLIKLKDFYFLKKKIEKKKFELFFETFNKKLYLEKTFRILKKIEYLNINKNFILSGLNLAFLGFYIKKSLKHHKNLVNWPDGIYSKYVAPLNKIPGRDIFRKIKINKKIKKIHVVGNLSLNSLRFLKKTHKLPVIFTKLPYGSIKKLLKEKIQVNKEQLIYITLPTPKQEQLAFELYKINNGLKIICIGASLNIASGEETPVPKILNKIEFIWRLKNDTLRRLQRLFITLFYYYKGKYNNTFKNIIFRIIEK